MSMALTCRTTINKYENDDQSLLIQGERPTRQSRSNNEIARARPLNVLVRQTLRLNFDEEFKLTHLTGGIDTAAVEIEDIRRLFCDQFAYFLTGYI